MSLVSFVFYIPLFSATLPFIKRLLTHRFPSAPPSKGKKIEMVIRVPFLSAGHVYLADVFFPSSFFCFGTLPSYIKHKTHFSHFSCALERRARANIGSDAQPFR